jgi:hypothetical protein
MNTPAKLGATKSPQRACLMMKRNGYASIFNVAGIYRHFVVDTKTCWMLPTSHPKPVHRKKKSSPIPPHRSITIRCSVCPTVSHKKWRGV